MNNYIVITDLYDNMFGDRTKNLIDSWGFSCLIESHHSKILFDVGRHSEVLLINLKRMQVDPTTIDTIVISHADDDHSHGLFGLLDVNKTARIFLVNQYPQNFLDTLANYKNDVVFVQNAEKPLHIAEGIYSSGSLAANRPEAIHYLNGQPKLEQSLFIVDDNMLTMIRGCSHVDLASMCEYAKEHFEKYPDIVLGGFHYADSSEDEIVKVLSETPIKDIEYLLPTHCSGKKMVELLSTGQYNRTKIFGLGSRMILSELTR